MKKIVFSLALPLLAFSFAASPAFAGKTRLITDTSTSTTTVPYINAAPADDSTAATALGVQVNGVEKMRVTASGSVGIGTTTPASTLSVLHPTNIDPSLTYQSAAAASINTGGVELAFGVATASPWTYWMQTRAASNTAWSMALNPLGGNVGIGTTTPAYTLDVNGNARTTGAVYAGASAILCSSCSAGYYQDPTNGAYRAVVSSSTTNGYYFQANGGSSTTMFVGLGGPVLGYVGIGTTNPSYNLDVNGSIRLSGAGLYNSSGYQIVQGNATDWLRINPNSSWPSGVAAISNWAFGSGGVAIGSWTNPGAGNLTVTGNVGIGTTSPGAKLEVNGTVKIDGSNSLYFYDFSHGHIYDDTWFHIESATGETTCINCNANGNVSIASGGGNVGIGTLSPTTAKLQVAGTIKSGSNRYTLSFATLQTYNQYCGSDMSTFILSWAGCVSACDIYCQNLGYSGGTIVQSTPTCVCIP